MSLVYYINIVTFNSNIVSYYSKNVSYYSKNVSFLNIILYSLNLRSDVRSGAAKRVQRTPPYAFALLRSPDRANCER